MTYEPLSLEGQSHKKLNPQIECALRDASNCSMAGDYQNALVLYDQILATEPTNIRALISKGNVYDLQGNYAEALRCYNLAIESDSYNAEAWYNKGVTLKKTGELEEGTRHIQKGISLSMGIY